MISVKKTMIVVKSGGSHGKYRSESLIAREKKATNLLFFLNLITERTRNKREYCFVERSWGLEE